MSFNHGWFRICYVLALHVGSVSKIIFSKDHASALTSSFNVNFPWMISLCSSDMFDPLNGTDPYNIENNTTPALHMSTPYPLYPWSSSISGAMYAGVPHCSIIVSPGQQSLDTPKSPIFRFPWWSSKMLSNLMSQCTMFFLWICYNPSISYLNIYLAMSSFNLHHFRT